MLRGRERDGKGKGNGWQVREGEGTEKEEKGVYRFLTANVGRYIYAVELVVSH
jgi:hypothetical protein